MGILLLAAALLLCAAVVGLGVWGMVRTEARLGQQDGSVLSHWAGQRRAAAGLDQDADRTAAHGR